MLTILSNLAVGVTIAVVSSVITVHLSLRRFRAEQWWSRKVDAYAKILEALHVAKHAESRYLDEIEEGRQYTEKYRKELAENSSAASHAIHKAIDTCSFLLCDEAVDELARLEKRLAEASKSSDYYEHLGMRYDAVRGCLVALIPIAKHDLNV